MSKFITIDKLMEKWELRPFQMYEILNIFKIQSVITGKIVDSKQEPCLFCTKNDFYGGKDVCPIQMQEQKFFGWDLQEYQYGPAERKPVSTLKPPTNKCKKFRSQEDKLKYFTGKANSLCIDASEVKVYEVEQGMTAPEHTERLGKKQSFMMTIIATPPNTVWEQVKIRIAKNDRFEIERPGYKMEFYNSEDLGFAKKRVLFAIFKAFAYSNGELKRYISTEINAANMSNLRKHLKKIFQDIEGDPISLNSEGKYVCEIVISIDKDEFSQEHYSHDEDRNEKEDWEDIMHTKR